MKKTDITVPACPGVANTQDHRADNVPPFLEGSWESALAARLAGWNTLDAVRVAAMKACKGHYHDSEVRALRDDFDHLTAVIHQSLQDGDYMRHVSYSPLHRTSKNGKKRLIHRPSLFTRILQYVWLGATVPVYDSFNPGLARNCLPGHGITADVASHSVLKAMKHLFYDRRDLHYLLCIDQRRCYEHIRPKQYRKAMKGMGFPRELIDFGEAVSFLQDRLPIGTPASPYVHHFVMLAFDKWLHDTGYPALRYADNIFVALPSREEAQAMKWRIKNWWWYQLGIRANRSDSAIRNIDREAVDVCGYVLRRIPGKGVTDHGKGTTLLRRSIRDSIRKCRSNRSYSSYFGLAIHADSFQLLLKTEKTMKLRQLTENIRIDRELDARKVEVRDLDANGITFDIIGYRLRADSAGKLNWLKCLISVEVTEQNAEILDAKSHIGRRVAREFHGSYPGLVEFLALCERRYTKAAILPIEDCRLYNQCGYIFEDSSNMKEFF